MTDSRQRVEAPITKHLEGLVQKGVPPASRTGLFSTPKFSFCDGQPVYLLSRKTAPHESKAVVTWFALRQQLFFPNQQAVDTAYWLLPSLASV
jgi:hypothetical protein